MPPPSPIRSRAPRGVLCTPGSVLLLYFFPELACLWLLLSRLHWTCFCCQDHHDFCTVSAVAIKCHLAMTHTALPSAVNHFLAWILGTTLSLFCSFVISVSFAGFFVSGPLGSRVPWDLALAFSCCFHLHWLVILFVLWLWDHWPANTPKFTSPARRFIHYLPTWHFPLDSSRRHKLNLSRTEHLILPQLPACSPHHLPHSVRATPFFQVRLKTLGSCLTVLSSWTWLFVP